MVKRIYLDYASLTPLDKRVARVMNKYHNLDYTNPSSLYASGVASKKAIQNAKERIAKTIHAHPDELIFTSGGTESNALVLKKFEGEKIVVSAIEHSSIITTPGVTTVSVDRNGIIDIEELKNAITPDTALVSVMMVNNEIGSIQPIHEIAKLIRDANKKQKNKTETRILFHVDASQSMYLPVHVEKLGVDLVTFDAQKMYGPRGMGMLYVKRGTLEIKRPGTENVPGIMGFATAFLLADKTREKESSRLLKLKQFFIAELQRINPGIKVNGSLESSSPHIVNIFMPGIDSEFAVLKLDAKGIECSTKSACLKDEDESYVLKAIGVESKNSLRFSFGRSTTKRQLKKALKAFIL